MLEFNPENNEMYTADYLVNRTMLITQANHKYFGEVCSIIPYRHSGHNQVYLYQSNSTEKGITIDRTKFLNIQWVNKDTFPEYFL